MSKGHPFSVDELLKEMEQDDKWWETCVMCHRCRYWKKKGCKFYKGKHYFGTCSLRKRRVKAKVDRLFRP